MRVRKRFAELQSMDEKGNIVDWHIVDAANSIEKVQLDINKIVTKTMKQVEDGKPLCKMFEEGEYILPSPSLKDEEEES